MQFPPVLIAVAPNGARLQASEHACVPLSPAALASTAAACLQAGAAMLHLHVRDGAGRHSLEPKLVAEAQTAIRLAVGDRLVIQMSTEACGRYAPAEQMAAVAAVRPEQASVALRELAPTADREADACRFVADCARRGTGIQFIVYDAIDAAKLNGLARAGNLGTDRPSVLLVLGRSRTPPAAVAADLADALRWPHAGGPRMICAFGPYEHALAVTGADAGLHARVGFENNRQRADGRVAPDNAALVADLSQALAARGYRTGTADDWRCLSRHLTAAA